MAQGDLFQATYRYNCGNQPITITLGFEHTGGTAGVEFELATMISVNVAGEMTRLKNWLSQQCTFESCRTRKLTGDKQPPGQVWSTDQIGLQSTAAIPQSKALMVTHRQTSAGVRSNGKSYISGLPETVVQGNVCNDQATIDGIVDIFDDLLLFSQTIPAGSADFRMVVLSYPNGKGFPPIGLPVVANRINGTLYNARRRQTREFGFVGDADLA